MTIMDMIRKMSEKKAATKQKFKELEEDAKLQKMLEERQKSSNERELERYMKEQREKGIREELEKIRKKQTKDSWKGQPMQKGASILKNDRPILKHDKNVLLQKSIFLDNKTQNPMTKEELFFKW